MTRLKANRKKLQRKRSYLRDRLKEKYQVDTRARIITLPYSTVEALPVPDRYYVRQLLRSGFTYQLPLFPIELHPPPHFVRIAA